jgi:hypothetical protein
MTASDRMKCKDCGAVLRRDECLDLQLGKGFGTAYDASGKSVDVNTFRQSALTCPVPDCGGIVTELERKAEPGRLF